jgi:hypothetical protein
MQMDVNTILLPQAKASNETQQRANDSKSDGMQRSGADALGGVINKVRTQQLVVVPL